MDTPLIFTSKGNVPIDGLRYEKAWAVTQEFVQFTEQWWDGEELVKNNVHLLSLQGLPPLGAAQAQM